MHIVGNLGIVAHHLHEGLVIVHAQVFERRNHIRTGKFQGKDYIFDIGFVVVPYVLRRGIDNRLPLVLFISKIDLVEKLKIDFEDIRITRMAQFAGDFDGDERIDFVHFGRGKKITVHRGQADAKYPKDPDLEILLEQEASDLQWVQVQDCDGDGRADLVLATERPKLKAEETAPVTLDLYLSGAAQ